MFLTAIQLKALVAQLHEARRSAEPCQVQRKGDPVFVPKPQLSDHIMAEHEEKGAYVFPNGDQVVKAKDGGYGILLTPGTHDNDFLVIDPESGKIVCGACAGVL